MTELFDAGELYPLNDPRNPFYGLDGFDARSRQSPDPYERIERQVLDSLGIDSFEEILIDSGNRTPEDMRGNRFESIAEAIVYLFDAGILRFSGVVVGAQEVEIEVKKGSP